MTFAGTNINDFPENQLGGILDARFATIENGCQYKNMRVNIIMQ